jgi:predicted DsbA family dithiol-disulfide isomerase
MPGSGLDYNVVLGFDDMIRATVTTAAAVVARWQEQQQQQQHSLWGFIEITKMG